MKRVLIAGVDGYLGWPLAIYLNSRGHEIAGTDCYNRRKWVEEVGSQSAIPIREMPERLNAFRELLGMSLHFIPGDITDYNFILHFLQSFKPDAIVHLAQMPSAPYSMVDAHHCTSTHTNNLLGTINILFAMREACPDAHLVKLGSMGEYGTPNTDIPEGEFELEFRGRKTLAAFPRDPGSFYHCTKVHDTVNIKLACKLWGLRATDIMQGIVFGTRIAEMGNDERLLTRFDFDQFFGTVINRFCAQAIIGAPITLYGKGNQKRGFLPLCDSMQCLKIAIENPPDKAEYRVFNQFEAVYSLSDLAKEVQKAALILGQISEVKNIENPRLELEEHYYNPDHQQLFDLGYRPSHNIDADIQQTLIDLSKYKSNIETVAHTLIPEVLWTGGRRKVAYL